MYQSIIKGDRQNLLDDEMVFMQKYQEIFDKKFFPDGVTASNNYLNMILNDMPMELSIKLKEFNIKMDT